MGGACEQRERGDGRDKVSTAAATQDGNTGTAQQRNI